jgi:hydroxymethylbilane synthase
MKPLVLATRGSRLALWQAEHIRSRLAEERGITTELLIIKTKGDIILDVPLAKVGGKGLFVKEIEEALLDGRADLAVHSMKDVPMLLPPGLVLGAMPPRETVEDLFLSKHFAGLDALPTGARIGTSSLRRQAQILTLYPDLTVVPLRGNVDTRLRKLEEDEFDAIIMAAAGIRRLGLTARHMIPLDPAFFLPAAGQGALGLEFREDRQDLHTLLSFMDHEPTRLCVTAERAFLAGLEGSCQTPIAAHALLHDKQGHPLPGLDNSAILLPPQVCITLDGLIADIFGTRIMRRSITGKADDAHALGHALADEIKSSGGAAILAESYHP